MKLLKIESSLGKLFKKQRQQKGLSQGSVSKILGYTSPQFLSNFERGLCNMPLNKLRKLIEIYEMDSEEVFNLIMELQAEVIRAELGQKDKKAKA